MDLGQDTPSVRTLLRDVLPRHLPQDAGAMTTTLLCEGRHVSVELRGDAFRLDAEHRVGTARGFEPGRVLVLRLVGSDGDLRIDLPVEVVESDRARSVLKVHARPVVLRRRMVFDQSLAEAVGAPARPARSA